MSEHPNQRFNSANFIQTNSYPPTSSAELRSSSSTFNTSSPPSFRPVSSTSNFEDYRHHHQANNASPNWTKPMPLPNLRDIFQDNFQRSTLPNNHVYQQHLSNNVSNTISNNVPYANTQPQQSHHHMWQQQQQQLHEEPPHVQQSALERNNTFDRTSSQNSFNSYGYSSSIGKQTKDFNSSSSSSPTTVQTNLSYNITRQDVHADSQQHLINQLRERIYLLERELETQHKTITELQRENYDLKTNKREFSDFQPEKKKKPQKKRKTSPISNDQLSNNLLTTQTTFSLVDEPGVSKQPSSLEEDLVLGGVEQFSVNWKGETYVLVDVFKNRTQIMNYFVPLYQSQFPDRNCKVVLSSEEYKQLFRENSHRSQSERKHAWRISIFTIDFYNFVKNQQV